MTTDFLNNILPFLQEIFSFNESRPLLFTQFYFWVFFAFVMAAFSFLYNRKLLRNTFLLAVSLFFYYKTSGSFLMILVFSTISDFVLGQLIYASKTQAKRRLFLFLSVFINLFVLSYFKYAYFFVDVINNCFGANLHVINYLAQAANTVSGASYFSVDKIILPVGISFYTFQTISYSVDVFKRRIEPVRNILNFGFYVSFFPQLVAGPIVRANEFVPQLYEKYFLTKKMFGIAIFWILNGLAKKMILSDYLAVNFVDRVFNNPMMYSGFENLMALFTYSMQVYADFSGYTDIAIGVAMLMGFRLPKNFNSPYKATNPGNFWKRWHISLSKWLTDYLYIPLGGNRNATVGTYLILAIIIGIIILLTNNIWIALILISIVLILSVLLIFWKKTHKVINTNINMMNTMLLGGLWHGASWNFMIWGGLNGLGILSFKIWRQLNPYFKTLLTAFLFALFVLLQNIFKNPAFLIGEIWTGFIFAGTLLSMLYHFFTHGKTLPKVNRAWSILLTFVFISFTRLFFRSGSNLDPSSANETAWETAKNMVQQIGSHWNWELLGNIIAANSKVFILLLLGLVIHWLPDKLKRRYRYAFAVMPLWLLLLICVVVVLIIFQFATADLQPFIYFQF
ncbi:MAG: MBOAT family protein [Bacteroidales bacterium]|jgi:D-alanyl-lipoteichoic acid acyltransferase DltB (MBOAT superfamily)|nr:MBOAT family protein [Bacteroidales bacterium]